MIDEIEPGERYEVTCDDCGRVDNFRGYNFIETVRRIREIGWQVKKNYGPGEEWEHFCPSCKQ